MKLAYSRAECLPNWNDVQNPKLCIMTACSSPRSRGQDALRRDRTRGIDSKFMLACSAFWGILTIKTNAIFIIVPTIPYQVI